MDRKLARGFAFVFAGQLGALALMVLKTPILVRLLNQAQYGDYAFLVSLSNMLLIVGGGGIPETVRKYLGENRSNRTHRSAIFGFYGRIAFALAGLTAVSVGAFTFFGPVGGTFGSAFVVYLPIVGGFVFIRQTFEMGRQGLLGLGLEHRSEPLLLSEHLGVAVVGLALVWAGYDVVGALVGHVVGTAAGGVLAFWFLRSHVDLGALVGRYDLPESRRDLLTLNAANVVFVVLLYGIRFTDVVLLQPLVGSEPTGVYKAALVLAELLWLAPLALETVLVANVASLWDNGAVERLQDITERFTRYTLLLTVLLGVGMAALAEAFVPLFYGPEYGGAVALLYVLLPGASLFAVSRAVIGVQLGSSHRRSFLLATATAYVLNLGLNLLLIPRMGAMGAAVATSLSYGTMLPLQVWSARRAGVDPAADVRILPVVVSGAVLGAVSFGLVELLPGRIELLVVPPVGFAVFVGTALATGAVARGELRRVLDWTRGQLAG